MDPVKFALMIQQAAQTYLTINEVLADDTVSAEEKAQIRADGEAAFSSFLSKIDRLKARLENTS